MVSFYETEYSSYSNFSNETLKKVGIMKQFIESFKKLFLLRTRSLMLLIIAFLVFQKIGTFLILNIILSKMILSKKLKSFSVGLFLFSFYSRIKIILVNGSEIFISKMRMEKKLIDDCGKKSLLINFFDVSINISSNNNNNDTLKAEKKLDIKEEVNYNEKKVFLDAFNKLENIHYCKLFKYTWLFRVFLFLIPIQLSFQKVKISMQGKEFYADYISVRLTYNKTTKKCNLSFFVHDFNNYKNLALKSFEFVVEVDWDVNFKSKTFKFTKYSSNLKIANLDLTLNKLVLNKDKDLLENEMSPKEKDKKLLDLCKQKEDLFQEYGEVFTRVCSFLKVVEFNVEDINVKIPNYNLNFYCASLITRFSAIDSMKLEKGYEFTLSSNTITLKIFEDKVISMPLLSVYLIGDSLYDFRDIENFACNVKCILSCIDCNIVIGEKHVEYLLENFFKSTKKSVNINEESSVLFQRTNDEKLSLMLYFFNFFSLDFKFLIPNASFTYLVGDSNITFMHNQSILHFKSPQNIYHLYDEILGGTPQEYNEDLRLTNTMFSMKTSDISIIFNDVINKKCISTDLFQLKKIEFQNYQNNIYQIDNLILGSEIKISDIIILKKLHNAVISLKEKINGYLLPQVHNAETNKKNAGLGKVIMDKIYCRARIVDSSIFNSFSNVIKKELDPSGQLFDKYYGFKAFVNHIDFKFHNKSRILTIDKVDIGLIEKSQTFNSGVKKTGSLKDILVDLTDGVEIILDTASLKMELATLWTTFYLISAYKSNFSNTKKQNFEKNSASSQKKQFNAKINTLLVDSYLVNEVNVLFSIKDIFIKQGISSIRLLQAFIESTYDNKSKRVEDTEAVFTRLLKAQEITIDTRKESLLDQFFMLLAIKIFELRSEYHLKFYVLFDSLVSTFKGFKQLKTGFTNLDNFIQNSPNSVHPFSIPPFKLKLKKFFIKVDEDPFEHKLNLIYKVGLSEQRLRMDKELIFQEELEELKDVSNIDSEEIANSKYRLYKNFSTSWIERIKKARLEFTNINAYDMIENEFLNKKVKIYSGHERIPLMVYSVLDMEFDIKPPSFGVDRYADFVFKYGKGVPISTVYTLLIMFNANFNAKMLKLQLRDYPLPLLFLPNVVLNGDIVMGEVMPDEFGIREVWVPFIKGCDTKISNLFGSNVSRTLNSIKFYANLNISIDSTMPSLLTWGKSLQPAIQAIMMWFDFLTKPPLDPSPKIGFWDKTRLLFHGFIKFEWSERSELHLNMKGSTDPYAIHEFGAGLTFCWKNGTSLTIHESSNPADFLKIKSKSFVLGVRNFDSQDQKNRFGKIMMELNGDVLWRLGLMFESGDLQHPGKTRRTAEFSPHYQVYLANPKKLKNLKNHDSYKKFRSNFIHMDIGVYSDNLKTSRNSVHLAPLCSEHFLAWWKLFSTYTSGPIRQGPLFPSVLQSSTKFGRSLFTIKYQMSFAPLEMAHVYRHSSTENAEIDASVFTGLKGKFDVFKLDLHQKRSPVMLTNDLLSRSKQVWKLKLDQGEIDFINADVRLIHSVFKAKATDEPLNENSTEFSWYENFDYTDLDDFKELSLKPDFLETISLLKTERLSYFRNIDRKVQSVEFPFGNEPFHNCLAGKNNSELTQLKIYENRLEDLNKMIKKLEMTEENRKYPNLSKKINQANDESLSYFIKQKITLENLIKQFESLKFEIERTNSTVSLGSEDLEMINPIPTLLSKKDDNSSQKRGGGKSHFDNKFVIHNMKLQLNDKSKKLLLAYANKMKERKAASFYDSYTSLSIIKEMMEFRKESTSDSRTSNASSINNNRKLDFDVKFDSLENAECIKQFEEIIRTVADVNFFSSDNMLLKFIMPQVQLYSNLLEDWATVLLANEIEVGIIDIIQGRDLDLIVKSIENLRETRICMLMSELKFFTLDKKSVLEHPSLKYEIDSKADNFFEDKFSLLPTGIESQERNRDWIPWLPVESFIDSTCLEKFKILVKSSMYLTFNNPNDLFFDKISHKLYDDDPKLRFGVPEMHIQSTSEQYNAIFTIFNDLMTFGSKDDKKWNSLTKTFIADQMKRNFIKSAQFIISLQKKIRAVRFERSIMKANDPESFAEIRDVVEKELDADRFELAYLMTSLKKNMVSNKKKGNTNKSNKVIWNISADDIIWDLYENHDKPFITFGLGFSSYQRTSYSDGSNSNKLILSTLHCFNLDQNSLYSELISPFKDYNKTKAPIIEIFWGMDKPVGGISQIRNIEFNVRPIKVQFEHIILEKIIEFLVNSASKNSDNVKDSFTGKQVSNLSTDTKSINALASGSSSNGNLANTMYVENSVISAKQGIVEMVKRSNKYIAIKKVVINKTVLSISYRGSKKLTNVNDLVVKMPSLKYENKIWSLEDFVSALKKDLIKIVLSHTGDIITNKFKKRSKIESKYESFKQFSKLLRADSMIDVSDQSSDKVYEPSKLRETNNKEFSAIPENDEESESIKELS
ncbi:hypothetical protein QEN19_000041 [Hanseniaspora menglaensis]